MASYTELNARPASDFLNASLFETGYDVCLDRAKAKYDAFSADLNDFASVHVSVNGTWGATTKTGGSVSSYEGIGYHAYTSDLLQAILDSDCPFYVYRIENDELVKHDMRELQKAKRAESAACVDGYNKLVRAMQEV